MVQLQLPREGIGLEDLGAGMPLEGLALVAMTDQRQLPWSPLGTLSRSAQHPVEVGAQPLRSQEESQPHSPLEIANAFKKTKVPLYPRQTREPLVPAFCQNCSAVAPQGRLNGNGTPPASGHIWKGSLAMQHLKPQYMWVMASNTQAGFRALDTGTLAALDPLLASRATVGQVASSRGHR
ncbi:hypothetical protein P7K49_024673 [Saguinus oedipus]|uniref:Uncharacterized protein n=1 Tax=Saguinus oedipus TaxID=9490 RepID=A0ABQ9UQ78_SAGOE|nr:hypothetical protein P7K49_024673 [Saguinus oedipus]